MKYRTGIYRDHELTFASGFAKELQWHLENGYKFLSVLHSNKMESSITVYFLLEKI
jgi:hypothetical protein